MNSFLIRDSLKDTLTKLQNLLSLVYTDYFADEKGNLVPPTHYGLSPDFPPEMLVTVTFEEHEGKTKLTMQQSVPESVAECNGVWQGWNESFDKLAENLG